MQTVAIFGVGLIGGSFALALRKAGFTGKIVGVSSSETIHRALELHIIDAASTAEEAARSADLIYLSQPIRRILEVLPDLDRWVKPEALITDAGSTKGSIVAVASRVVSRCQFLGGHPMAGKEQRGVEAADPDLFLGRKYVLTPISESEMRTAMAAEFLAWIAGIGAIPVVLGAEQHDRMVAYASHLPQLASTALARVLEGRAEAIQISGPALADMTRLALSHFEVWGDILATNHDAIGTALRAYIQSLEAFSTILESQEMAREFEGAALVARRIRQSNHVK